MQKKGIHKLTLLGLCTATALVLAYLESLLPPIVTAIPGIKMGLPNVVIFFVLYRYGLPEAAAVSFVRLLAVTFAFVTNKLFVFEARGVKRLPWEMLTFFASRLFTGLLDVGIMYLFVDVIGANDILIKIISNLVVIILNFVLSRLIVFARGRK